MLSKNIASAVRPAQNESVVIPTFGIPEPQNQPSDPDPEVPEDNTGIANNDELEGERPEMTNLDFRMEQCLGQGRTWDEDRGFCLLKTENSTLTDSAQEKLKEVVWEGVKTLEGEELKKARCLTIKGEPGCEKVYEAYQLQGKEIIAAQKEVNSINTIFVLVGIVGAMYFVMNY